MLRKAARSSRTRKRREIASPSLKTPPTRSCWAWRCVSLPQAYPHVRCCEPAALSNPLSTAAAAALPAAAPQDAPAPPYVPPDEREQRAAAVVVAASQRLQQEGYPGLAVELEAAAARLKKCVGAVAGEADSCAQLLPRRLPLLVSTSLPAILHSLHNPSLSKVPLVGSLTEAETGAPLVLPLTEHAALLALLLRLQGSRPSLRQRAFTFQAEAVPASGAAAAAEAAAAAVGTPDQPPQRGAAGTAASPAAVVPLATRVFEEAPNPHALTDGEAAVAVLMPAELGLPTDAFAGSEHLQVSVDALLRLLWCSCCHCPACTRLCSLSRLPPACPRAPPCRHIGPWRGAGQPARVGTHCRRRAACAARALVDAAAGGAARAAAGQPTGRAGCAAGPAAEPAEHGR